MTGAARREFLGWERPLDVAADRLLETHGGQLSEVVVAVPGRRAGRLLRDALLARRPALWLPGIVTAGQLPDQLLPWPGRPAERLTRTAVWADVLSATSDLSALTSRPPERDDWNGWTALAAQLRGLHAELLAEGRRFADVRAVLAGAPAAERARWDLLVRLQRRYEQRMDQLGLVDPHAARWAACDTGPRDGGPVVLLGVVELSALQRRVLEALGGRLTVLVAAAAGRAEDFDTLGALRVPPWTSSIVPLREDRWWVEDRPADVAQRVAALLAGREAPGEATVGVPDETLAPLIAARLAGLGIASRSAAGDVLGTSGAFRLLDTLATWLEEDGVAAFAGMCRHPDVEARLAGEADGPSLAEDLDRLDGWSLPRRVPIRWRADERRAGARRRVQAATDALRRLVRPLTAAPRRRPLRDWAEPLRGVLADLWRERVLDPEADRALVELLSAVGARCDELAALPEGLLPTRAAQALRLVLGQIAALPIPAPPDATAVELLGWLELPLDPGEPLIVTGFEEGRIPESGGGHPFLSDGLRSRLGLPDADQRLARDAAWLTGLLASGREVHLITGRREATGDPTTPSRLAFHCDEERLPARVQRAFADPAQPAPPVARAPDPPRPERPVPTPTAPLEALSVTDFAAWLRSPYACLLERRLGLDRAEDGLRELDPREFGSLAHDVLEAFGEHERGADPAGADVERVAASLDALLDARLAERFGDELRPAVSLQVAQLRARLARFARQQAEWHAQGWRIREVEWQPDEPGVSLVVDGEPVRLKGRIDRIDAHIDGERFALLDYKTGDEGKSPGRVHRQRDGAWSDLQLPLYALLARPLVGPRAGLVFGYVNLPADAERSGFELAAWDAADLAGAEAVAHEVVRRMRAGEHRELGDYRDRDPILAAIARLGLPGSERPGSGLALQPPSDRTDETAGADDACMGEGAS